MTLQEFLYMGGYYPFVWPAYALALLVLIGTPVAARRRERRILRRVVRQDPGRETGP